MRSKKINEPDSIGAGAATEKLVIGKDTRGLFGRISHRQHSECHSHHLTIIEVTFYRLVMVRFDIIKELLNIRLVLVLGQFRNPERSSLLRMPVVISLVLPLIEVQLWNRLNLLLCPELQELVKCEQSLSVAELIDVEVEGTQTVRQQAAFCTNLATDKKNVEWIIFK